MDLAPAEAWTVLVPNAPMNECELLFVYGTLRPGEANYWIAPDVVAYATGSAHGALYLPAHRGFPLANFDEAGTVAGTLVLMRRGELLDQAVAMELGAGYDGRIVDVTVPGPEVDVTYLALAFHYDTRYRRDRIVRISTGDWFLSGCSQRERRRGRRSS